MFLPIRLLILILMAGFIYALSESDTKCAPEIISQYTDPSNSERSYRNLTICKIMSNENPSCNKIAELCEKLGYSSTSLIHYDFNNLLLFKTYFQSFNCLNDFDGAVRLLSSGIQCSMVKYNNNKTLVLTTVSSNFKYFICQKEYIEGISNETDIEVINSLVPDIEIPCCINLTALSPTINSTTAASFTMATNSTLATNSTAATTLSTSTNSTSPPSLNNKGLWQPWYTSTCVVHKRRRIINTNEVTIVSYVVTDPTLCDFLNGTEYVNRKISAYEAKSITEMKSIAQSVNSTLSNLDNKYLHTDRAAVSCMTLCIAAVSVLVGFVVLNDVVGFIAADKEAQNALNSIQKFINQEKKNDKKPEEFEFRKLHEANRALKVKMNQLALKMSN